MSARGKKTRWLLESRTYVISEAVEGGFTRLRARSVRMLLNQLFSIRNKELRGVRIRRGGSWDQSAWVGWDPMPGHWNCHAINSGPLI